MKEIIIQKQIKKIVNEIKKDKEVAGILLFGSYNRKKEYARDVDLCVMFDKGDDKLVMAKKRLNYLSKVPDKFDIQIFQLLPLHVRIKILKEGKVLYSKKMRKIYDTAYKTVKEYNLFEPHYKDYVKMAA